MRDSLARRDAVALATLSLAGICIPLWLAVSAGAIGLPTLDDWVYMRAASGLFRTGSLDTPLRSAAAFGQIVLVQPMLWLSAGSPWAFSAFGLVMTLIAIAATYLLSRRLVGTGSAVLIVLLVVAFPGFAREAASFMTDIPAYALAMVCLLLGVMWLQGEVRNWALVASLVAGLVAASTREFTIAAPAAILATGWARNRRDERAMLAGLSSILVFGLASVLIGASISGRVAPGVPDGSLRFLGAAFATLALVLLPAAVLAMADRLRNFSPIQLMLGVTLACLVFFLPNGVPVGNLWTDKGIGADLLLAGNRSPLISGPAWALSGQLALFAAIICGALAFRWIHRNVAEAEVVSRGITSVLRLAQGREAPLVVFLCFYAVELVVYTQLGPVIDRYLYPMVPAAAILLLRGKTYPFRPGRNQAFVHAALVWLIASSLAIAANSFAYDAARYRAGDATAAMGYDATTIDAGYEWVGMHAVGDGKAFSGTYQLTWYESFWPSFRPCAVLSNSALDDTTFRLIHIDRSAYSQFLFLGPAEPLYLYGAVGLGCPSPPAAARPTQASSAVGP